MPRRTESHIVGDTAINQVFEVCYACGWACECVHNDYGEDILVQTALNQEVDPYRILVQCKGTREIGRYKRKKGDYSYLFPIETVRKWVRSKDLMVVLLWDVTKKYGVWTLLDDLDESRLFETGDISVTFGETNVFDARRAAELAWTARLSHYNYLLLASGEADRVAEECGDPNYQCRTMPIALDFLRRVGIVKAAPDGRFGLDESFASLLRNLIKHFASEEQDNIAKEANSVLRRAGMMAFMAHLEQRTKVGCPRELIIRCGTEAAYLMSGLVSDSHKHLG